MRKTVFAVAVSMALSAGQVFAQAAEPVVQCEQPAEAFVPKNADAAALERTVTDWVLRCGGNAAEIVGAAVTLYPDQAVVVAKAAFAAAPDQLNEIIEVIASLAPDQLELVVAALTEEQPTAAGGRESRFGTGQDVALPAGGSGGGSAIRTTASAS